MSLKKRPEMGISPLEREIPDKSKFLWGFEKFAKNRKIGINCFEISRKMRILYKMRKKFDKVAAMICTKS